MVAHSVGAVHLTWGPFRSGMSERYAGRHHRRDHPAVPLRPAHPRDRPAAGPAPHGGDDPAGGRRRAAGRAAIARRRDGSEADPGAGAGDPAAARGGRVAGGAGPGIWPATGGGLAAGAPQDVEADELTSVAGGPLDARAVPGADDPGALDALPQGHVDAVAFVVRPGDAGLLVVVDAAANLHERLQVGADGGR